MKCYSHDNRNATFAQVIARPFQAPSYCSCAELNPKFFGRFKSFLFLDFKNS